VLALSESACAYMGECPEWVLMSELERVEVCGQLVHDAVDIVRGGRESDAWAEVRDRYKNLKAAQR